MNKSDLDDEDVSEYHNSFQSPYKIPTKTSKYFMN